MKAKDLLREIIKVYPNVVAIAQDKNKDVKIFVFSIPYEIPRLKNQWWNPNKVDKIPCSNFT